MFSGLRMSSELGFGEQISLEHEFVNAPICDEAFLGYGGTLFVKYDRSVAQQRESKKQVKGDEWLRHVQLKFTGLAGHGDRNAAPMIWKQTWLTTSGRTEISWSFGC